MRFTFINLQTFLLVSTHYRSDYKDILHLRGRRTGGKGGRKGRGVVVKQRDKSLSFHFG